MLIPNRLSLNSHKADTGFLPGLGHHLPPGPVPSTEVKKQDSDLGHMERRDRLLSSHIETGRMKSINQSDCHADPEPAALTLEGSAETPLWERESTADSPAPQHTLVPSLRHGSLQISSLLQKSRCHLCLPQPSASEGRLAAGPPRVKSWNWVTLD